jgi:hypothetical protein
MIIPRHWRGTWEGVPMATWCSEWICRTWGGLGPHILIFPTSKFVISPADARYYNKSCTDNSSRWLVLQEYPILSNLQFCRPLGWRLPHSWRRNNFLVRPIQHDPGARTPQRLIYVSPVYCACATAWSSTSGGTCLRRACVISRASSYGACCCTSSCGSNTYSANGTFCTSHVHTGPGHKLFRCGRWSSWGMRVFTWGLTSSPEVGRWQEGLWHGLFFPVFIFSLTSSLRCQKGRSRIKLHLFDT